MMTTAEIALSAALGASFLTSASSLGILWLREHLRGKASGEAALHAAVLEVLSRSLSVAMRSNAIGETMRLRSGLTEGLDIALHHRKPVDLMELHDWMAQDLIPLHTALTEIWTRWDQEGIRRANDVVGKCAELMDASVALQPAGTARERLRKWAIGEQWTPEMTAQHQRTLERLAQARKDLADYARARLSQGPVDLFAQVPDDKGQPAINIAPSSLEGRQSTEAPLEALPASANGHPHRD